VCLILRTDTSKERIAPIIRVTGMGELGTTLAVRLSNVKDRSFPLGLPVQLQYTNLKVVHSISAIVVSNVSTSKRVAESSHHDRWVVHNE
jgi:hypothetical protein